MSETRNKTVYVHFHKLAALEIGFQRPGHPEAFCAIGMFAGTEGKSGEKSCPTGQQGE
ncbi:hypothetical protein [Mangrovibacter yixingensis]|uniref:hypothetical protein n=1 Tax=Mangrovibacter yixingensis TaxID=1529639 RepID=UPI001CFBDEFC|nr:hypothetical protein [Mangrovibacter yixingensis]